MSCRALTIGGGRLPGRDTVVGPRFGPVAIDRSLVARGRALDATVGRRTATDIVRAFGRRQRPVGCGVLAVRRALLSGDSRRRAVGCGMVAVSLSTLTIVDRQVSIGCPLGGLGLRLVAIRNAVQAIGDRVLTVGCRVRANRAAGPSGGARCVAIR